MARETKSRSLEPVINAAQQWIRDCLIGDNSVFSTDPLWTPENVAEVRRAFVDHPDEGDDTFPIKLKGQMESASASAKRLMAEMVWALLLFPSNIRVSTKRHQVGNIWSMSGEQLREDLPLLSDEVLSGIGSGGPGFNNHRWRELVFLISLVGDLKQRASGERQQLVSEYDAFIDWIAQVPQEGHRQFRHMLRFFCFPDRVERMSSNRERWAVIAGFGVASEKEAKRWSDRQLDDTLLALRKSLKDAHWAEVLDFYEEPLRDRWRVSEKEPGDDEISARNPGVSFSAEDCNVFARYPNSVSWGEVQENDQLLFKSIRSRLKALSEFLVESNATTLALRAETSHPTPNGRSPKEIWCCVFPSSVSNKSYGLQVALIISERGAEICFCRGSGGSQIADPAKKHELEAAFQVTLNRLGQVSGTEICAVEDARKRRWFFRESWLAKPNEEEFSTLQTWLNQASRPESRGASISAYLTPAELQELGNGIFSCFAEALQTFGPILHAVYSGRAENLTGSGTPPVAFDSSALSMAMVAIEATHMEIGREFLNRFVTSLAAKPFLILTGNSGTGKTKLAEVFVQWLCRNTEDRLALVPVGADWTDNRDVLGFVNHLRSTKVKEDGVELDLPVYQTTKILDLLLNAVRKEAERKPHFLILDEMNLSHVERYFADFLSTMESKEGRLLLHREGRSLPRKPGGPCDVPEALALPRNVFVIGTVNVDETTYMFSPKVLDRANVIEFRVGADAPMKFLESGGQRVGDIAQATAGYAEGFLELSFRARSVKGPSLALVANPDLPPDDAKDGLEKCRTTIADLFALMQKRHQEFAFRSMAEILRFLAVTYELKPATETWNWEAAMDAQILQKVLPKLHGSKRKVGSLLAALAKYCEQGNRTDAESLLMDEPKAEAYLASEDKRVKAPQFKESYQKLCEMMEAVRRDQFVSFIQ